VEVLYAVEMKRRVKKRHGNLLTIPLKDFGHNRSSFKDFTAYH
jgi:hypothetical protein